MISAMPDLLFLYGTLLPDLAGRSIARRLAALKRIGAATLPGRLFDLGAYPGLVFDVTGDATVAGDLFALPDDPAPLAALDAYEGYLPNDPAGSLYLRRQRIATLPDGRTLPAWVYEYNRDLAGATLIPDGDYRAWVARGQ